MSCEQQAVVVAILILLVYVFFVDVVIRPRD